MIKNSPLFLSLILLSKSYSVEEISTLAKMCSNLFVERELDEESKKNFNDFVDKNKPDLIKFDCKHKTIQDHDFSNMHLKGFDFTETRLIEVNFKDAILKNAIFNGTTFQKIDFRNTNLKNVKFTNCKFTKCNLEHTDLSKTSLEGCKFKKVQLHKAHLGLGLVFDDKMPHLELVKLYAEFIKNGQKDKAKALNKIFGVLRLKLEGADLKGLDLTDIDLRKAQLKRSWIGPTQLQNVRLSDTLVLPNYKNNIELVKLYHHFIIKEEVKNAETLNSIFESLYLDLGHTNLSNLDLKRINLSKANLYNANLTNTNLTDANLKYANLYNATLKGVSLSDTLTLKFNDLSELFYRWIEDGPHKHLYQKLVNAHVPLFDDIADDKLKKVTWKGLDLRNISLEGAKLSGCDFTNTNLKKSSLNYTTFQGAIFIGANLKKAMLNNSDLSGADLRGAKLNKINLDYTNLRGTRLSDDFYVNYSNHPKELFKEWAENNQYRPLYQKLIHAKIPIIESMPENIFKQIDWRGLNFKDTKAIYRLLNIASKDDPNFKNVWSNDLGYSTHLIQLYSQLNHYKRKKFHAIFLKNFKFYLRGANLQNLNLKGLCLKNSNLQEADLSEPDLTGTDLIGANLRGTKLSYNDLIENRWMNVKLSNGLVIGEVIPSLGIEDLIEILELRGVLIDQEKSENHEPPLKKIKLEK